MKPPCKKAIIDTSIILYFAEHKIDFLELFLQDEICLVIVTTHVLNELRYQAAAGKGARARKAKLALELLREKILAHPTLFALKHYSVSKPTDDLLIEVALAGRYTLLTADKVLRNKAMSKGVNVLFLLKSRRKLI